MINVFSLFLNSVVHLYPIYLFNNKKNFFQILFLTIISTFLLFLVSTLSIQYVFKEFINILIFLTLAFLFSEGRRRINFLIEAIIIACSNLFSQVLIYIFLYFYTPHLYNLPKIIKFGSIIIELCNLALASLIIYFFKKRYFTLHLDDFESSLVIAIPSIIIFEGISLQMVIYSTAIPFLELLTSLISLGLNYIILYKYYYSRVKATKEKLVERDLFLSSEQIQEINRSQKEVRKLRHDMNTLLITVRSLNNSNNYEAANHYIDNYIGYLESAKTPQYCSIEYINNLIYYKHFLNPTIKFIVDSQCDSDPNIDPIDLSLIFANALDNAIHEISANEHIEPEILIKIRQNNDLLAIKIRNALSKEKNLTTETKDFQNHGFGLKIIDQISKKYAGYMEITQDKYFTLDVMLNINESESSND